MQRSNSPVAKWQEWALFGLGLWLAVSPWLAGYHLEPAATANAAFAGIALALAAHFDVSFGKLAGAWVNLAGGLWLIMAPFVLEFDGVFIAAANSVIVGALIAMLSASGLELNREVGKWWHRVTLGH